MSFFGLFKKHSPKANIPEHLIGKPKSEWSIWELRRYSHPDGKPTPIAPMMPKALSSAEVNRSFDRSLKLSPWQRIKISLLGKQRIKE